MDLQSLPQIWLRRSKGTVSQCTLNTSNIRHPVVGLQVLHHYCDSLVPSLCFEHRQERRRSAALVDRPLDVRSDQRCTKPLREEQRSISKLGLVFWSKGDFMLIVSKERSIFRLRDGLDWRTSLINQSAKAMISFIPCCLDQMCSQMVIKVDIRLEHQGTMQ